MTSTITSDPASGGASRPEEDVKRVPQEQAVREAVRARAARMVSGMSRSQPLARSRLDELGAELLDGLGLDRKHLGFAMVSISSEFWRDQFAAVPPTRRLLLLPHCLRDPELCRGTYSPLGLECAGCGACLLYDLRLEAESLGYSVVIAEGTPVVVEIVLSGRADAILGVACLDSLDQAFDRIAQLGVPNIAVPLLVDGCVNTVADLDAVQEWLHLQSDAAGARTRSYVPLLRTAQRLFQDDDLDSLVGGIVELGLRGGDRSDCAAPTIAMEWLRNGGKRFRPFITLACYAALVHGSDALRPDADLSQKFPPAVERLAVAIEALHKASLVHDDIEDDDLYRYGRETLHRRYGVAPAINVGDLLIGLGYRCICEGMQELGADCVADLVKHLAGSHVRMCRGQGSELVHHGSQSAELSEVDVQTIYALKTAPAFETAVYAGVRAAQGVCGIPVDIASIGQFSLYLGVAYQVANDLKDWDHGAHDKLVAGQDLLSDRPTMLRAFAHAAGGDAACASVDGLPPMERIEKLRDVYEQLGVFDKARRLVAAYKQRAIAAADLVEPDQLRGVMRFIVDTIL